MVRDSHEYIHAGDIFQIVPDSLPFIPGTNRTLVPTLVDEMNGGDGYDQVMFLGGDLDSQGRPVRDFVSLRWNRFLHRYEFTSLIWVASDARRASCWPAVTRSPTLTRISWMRPLLAKTSLACLVATTLPVALTVAATLPRWWMWNRTRLCQGA